MFVVALALASSPAYMLPNVAAAADDVPMIGADDVGGAPENLTDVDDNEATDTASDAESPFLAATNDVSSSTVVTASLNGSANQDVVRIKVSLKAGETRFLFGVYEATNVSSKPVLQAAQITCAGPETLKSTFSTTNHTGSAAGKNSIAVHALLSVTRTGNFTCALKGWARQSVGGAEDDSRRLLKVVAGRNTALTLSGVDHTGGQTWGDTGDNPVPAGKTEYVLRNNWTALTWASNASFYADVELDNPNRQGTAKATLELGVVQLKGRGACPTATEHKVASSVTISKETHHSKVFLHLKGINVKPDCDLTFAVKVRVSPTSSTGVTVYGKSYTSAIALNASY